MTVDTGFMGQDLYQLLATFFAGCLIFQLIQWALVLPLSPWHKPSASKKLACDDDDNDADHETECGDGDVTFESDSDSEVDNERSAAAARGLLDRLRPPPPDCAPPPPPCGLVNMRTADRLINVCLGTNQALDELDAMLSDSMKSSSSMVVDTKFMGQD